MPDREAPRVFITYAHDSQQHKITVERFGRFLRSDMGLDVRLDSWDDGWRQDWSAWAIEQLTEADFILVIASPDYRIRADGMAAPSEGRGSQFEAAMIRNEVTKDLQRATRRILPVVLPGRSIDDIPTFLNPYSTTRFHVSEFSAAGVAELVAAITGDGPHPMPTRGQWPGGAASNTADTPNVLVAGLSWLAHSVDVRAGGALIDGVHHPSSIVQRPASPTQDASGFVEVDLDRAYRRMTAMAGVLDDAAEPFQVGRFRVHLDGRLRFEDRAAVGRPATVDVDVTGVRRLRLEMYRENTTASPLHSGAANGRSRRLPELAWGNPTLS
ncbi:MAG TPA: SEFIR domain-containing protein [Pseudonocardiaceae bacterium]|nr:SEFIR domain-containing protein [Pseudonocardiaceae bacterium]